MQQWEKDTKQTLQLRHVDTRLIPRFIPSPGRSKKIDIHPRDRLPCPGAALKYGPPETPEHQKSHYPPCLLNEILDHVKKKKQNEALYWVCTFA